MKVTVTSEPYNPRRGKGSRTGEPIVGMSDKELADKVVAILDPHCPIEGKYFTIPGSDDATEEQFVRDWRVCGALIEKCQKIYAEYIGDSEQAVYARSENNRTWEWIHGESLPRAIIEACVEALSHD